MGVPRGQHGLADVTTHVGLHPPCHLAALILILQGSLSRESKEKRSQPSLQTCASRSRGGAPWSGQGALPRPEACTPRPCGPAGVGGRTRPAEPQFLQPLNDRVGLEENCGSLRPTAIVVTVP